MSTYSAGVDEVGRGPLAGPVVAAAVVLPPGSVIAGLKDSKKLSPRQRMAVYARIKMTAIDCAVGTVDVVELDAINNILQASLLAMQRAVAALQVTVTLLWVDGPHAPQCPCDVRTVVGGDSIIPEISAASVIAKETRDNFMRQLAQEPRYQKYGFERHKGYPTPEHLRALQRYGVSDLHRKSFKPVKALLCDTAERT